MTGHRTAQKRGGVGGVDKNWRIGLDCILGQVLYLAGPVGQSILTDGRRADSNLVGGMGNEAGFLAWFG